MHGPLMHGLLTHGPLMHGLLMHGLLTHCLLTHWRHPALRGASVSRGATTRKASLSRSITTVARCPRSRHLAAYSSAGRLP